MTDEAAARAVVDLCRQVLPGSETWLDPGGHPDSLALCVINSIQSMGVRFGSVRRVVARYDSARPGLAATDGAYELAATFGERGGVDCWVRDIGNRHRTSSRPGAPLKAEVILEAATMLQAAAVQSTRDLRALGTERLAEVKAGWLALPGQHSGISWRYLLMLAGVPGVKADRMICRFVATATQQPYRTIRPPFAEQAVERAAALLDVAPNVLDHAIWRWQSGRR